MADEAIVIAELDEKIRLLLVDDEVDFLAATAAALTRRGLEVTTAASASEALRLASEARFDVVVLDIKLPEMTGIELLRQLKERDPSAEVIVLTGRPSMGTAVEGVREGVFDYLIKPQSVDALLARIRQAHLCRGLRRPASRA